MGGLVLRSMIGIDAHAFGEIFKFEHRIRVFIAVYECNRP